MRTLHLPTAKPTSQPASLSQPPPTTSHSILGSSDACSSSLFLSASPRFSLYPFLPGSVPIIQPIKVSSDLHLSKAKGQFSVLTSFYLSAECNILFSCSFLQVSFIHSTWMCSLWTLPFPGFPPPPRPLLPCHFLEMDLQCWGGPMVYFSALFPKVISSIPWLAIMLFADNSHIHLFQPWYQSILHKHLPNWHVHWLFHRHFSVACYQGLLLLFHILYIALSMHSLSWQVVSPFNQLFKPDFVLFPCDHI